jgi:sulfite reductase (NADPH) hemoprotein beta-component
VVETYLELRAGPQEPFLALYRRLGATPFKDALYAAA